MQSNPEKLSDVDLTAADENLAWWEDGTGPMVQMTCRQMHTVIRSEDNWPNLEIWFKTI